MSHENVKPLSVGFNSAFANNQSSLQKIDPRARIICTLLFSVIVVLSEGLLALTVALIFSLILACYAKLPLKSTLKKMAAMDSFMLYLMLLLPFTVSGDAFVEVFGYLGSWQGLWQGVSIALKANAVVLMLFASVSILSSSALGSALAWFKVSDKLIQLLLFTMRYLSVIAQEYTKLRRSMKARAFVMRFNWHSWKSMGYLIGMLLLRSMQRSQRVMNAMKCRGYRGRFVSYYPFNWDLSDVRYCVLMAGVMFVIVSLNFVGGI